MAYVDTFLSRKHRYSIGIESKSDRYYVSIPVTNGALDYEEYYELSETQYHEFLAHGSAAIEFVESCRRHEQDKLLIEKPGWNRGTPV